MSTGAHMHIYRVFEPYHYDDESGTYEYGYFTTLEAAKKRMETVWAQKGYGEPTDRKEMYLSQFDGFSMTSICINEYPVDKDFEARDVGYT